MTPTTSDAGELLSVAEVAKRARVQPGQVRRWVAAGIRAGAKRVRLKAAACYGARCLIAEADLAAFERQCREARFGAEAGETVPTETPAQTARRGKAAKERLAKLLEN